uniref:Ribosomal protein L21 n=1 Tax=Panagrolaimus sp. JU765 TaxID=591449 RepID=A0AC34R1T2_9BILA
MLKKAVQQVVSSCRWSTSASFSTTIKPQLVNVGEKQSKIVENISDSLARKTDNRLFAVVFAHNRQFKVSQNDLIQLHHNSILDIGQKIQLEKVLLVGGKDFTLFGRPLLDPQTVKVFATVVEKTSTSPDLFYYKLSGKKVQRMLWMSHELTALRINEIQVDPEALI